MKLLRATKRTQGQRENDFFWTNENELVYLGMICGKDLWNGPDGPCGCGRSFVGLDSSRGATTAEVTEEQLTEEAAMLLFIPLGIGTEALRAITEITKDYPVGAVLEKRGHFVQAREETT